MIEGFVERKVSFKKNDVRIRINSRRDIKHIEIKHFYSTPFNSRCELS